jgi:type II secretory pathway pseudopilin PulG
MIGSARQAQSVKPRRRGISLVELVVVMGIATVMLGLAVTTIHMLLRAEWNSTETVWYGTSLARFSRTFRQDVHAATSAGIPTPPPDGKSRLELTLPKQRTVTFRIDGNTITRLEADAGKVRHGDVYHFPPKSTIRFGRTQEPALVHVVINRPSMPEALAGREDDGGKAYRPAGRVLRIEAAVARDHRFARRD